MKFNSYMNEEFGLKEGVEKIKEDCDSFIKEMKGSNYFLYRGTNSFSYSVDSTKFIKVTPNILKVLARKNRTPSDMPRDVHEYLNNEFKKKFGWKVRSEGIFATYDERTAKRYGGMYIFFPIDKYKYVYSNEIEDLYEHFGFLGEHQNAYVPESLAKDPKDKLKKNSWLKIYKSKFVTTLKQKWPEDDDEVAMKKFNEFLDKEMEMEKDRIVSEIDRVLKTYKTTNLKSANKRTEIMFKCDEYYMIKSNSKIEKELRSLFKE